MGPGGWGVGQGCGPLEIQGEGVSGGPPEMEVGGIGGSL